MSRFLLQFVLPLILPTVLYVLWWWAIGRRRADADGRPGGLARGPWFWLILAGLVLLGAALIATALTTGTAFDGRYVPPQLEGGRVVPGHMDRSP